MTPLIEPKEVDLTYYYDGAGAARWRMVARNGEQFDASHQGFATMAGAMENFALIHSVHVGNAVDPEMVKITVEVDTTNKPTADRVGEMDARLD